MKMSLYAFILFAKWVVYFLYFGARLECSIEIHLTLYKNVTNDYRHVCGKDKHLFKKNVSSLVDK